MHGELYFPASTVLAFALVLSRTAGVFVFIPMPVKDAGPDAARIVLALACTIALFPSWPAVNAEDATFGKMAVWLLSELALGTAIGLMVSFISESLTLGAQILSFQAGYGYASAIDPTTNADSDVLPVLAQLMAALLFFTTGLDRYVIQAFALSLESFPPGTFLAGQDLATTIIHLGASIFAVGLRLAFPVIGLLLITEIALALLGRLNSQFHLGMHAFPAKMLLTLLTLAAILVVVPVLYQSFAAEVMRAIRHSFLP